MTKLAESRVLTIAEIRSEICEIRSRVEALAGEAHETWAESGNDEARALEDFLEGIANDLAEQEND